MPLLGIIKPDHKSIDDISEFYDKHFVGLGFSRDAYKDHEDWFEITYKTKQSGSIRALYIKDGHTPFIAENDQSKERVNIHVFFDLVDMSDSYRNKISDLIFNPNNY